MPSKQIRSDDPNVSGGGGSSGGTATPTFEYNTPVHIRDAMSFGISRNEPLHIRDAMTFGISRNEALHARDGYTINVSPIYNDHLRVVDAFLFTLTNLIVGRSGTPDSDQMSDAWVDQTVTALNHGNESLQCKGATTAPGSDQKIAYLQVDLTKVTGVTAGAAGGSLTFMASTSNLLLATAVGIKFSAQSTRWFTESTVNYTTRPAAAANSLPSASIATGAAASYSVAISQANLNLMIGNWVLFQFTTAGAVLPDTVTVLSRDDATAANRPQLTAALKLP